MYSTKESYRDLNSIINSPDENPEQHQNMNKPALRTSIADRLDKAGLAEPEYETETDGEDKVSVIDLDDHLADRRTSYYDGSGKRASRASTTKRYNVHSSSGQRPKSKVPDLPKNDYDDTFVSNSDEVHKRQYKSMVSDESSASDDVFDKIKLPDGKSTKSSIDELANGTSTSGHRKPKIRHSQPGPEMLIPHLNGGIESSQPMSKVRGNNSSGHDDSVPPPPPAHKVNKNHWMIRRISSTRSGSKKKRFIFRKLSWGSKNH